MTANNYNQVTKSETSRRRRKLLIILAISMLILLSVNTLVNSSGIGKRMPGRSVTGGCVTIIERLRRSCPIALGRWSHFS